MFHAPNQYRITTGVGATVETNVIGGAFRIPIKKTKFFKERLTGYLQVVASDSDNWEHIAVTVVNGDMKTMAERYPTWEEMNHAKDLFWDETDECIQFFSPKKENVNQQKYILHIYKRKAPYRINQPSTLEDVKAIHLNSQAKK